MLKSREPDRLKERLGRMNEAQRQAVLHGEGPLLLLAGPGSGKTFTITNRIGYLLEQGVPPETILVITFTKEAALSMQNRFREMSDVDHKAFYPVNFGTFHSVFYHILRESHVLRSNDLLNLSEKKNLLFPVLKSCDRQKEPGREESFQSLSEDAVQILSAISYYKNTMQREAAKGRLPAEWQPYFAQICREYERSVKRLGRVDFDDMLYDCRRLLEENRGARHYWQGRFRHILIDEFQDINPVQYEVVKLLASSPYNLFAVGDDDQAIYGFRGSEPDCLKRFAEEFHARQLLLDVNYRSRNAIVQASLAVIGENRDRFPKKLRAAGAQGAEGTVPGAFQEKGAEGTVLRAFQEKEAQYGYLLRALSEKAEAGESRAVLFRTNSCMQGFAARMKAADIPYVMREKASSIYEHFIAADLMAYLLSAQGQGTREQMLRIMNRPSRYISREALGDGVWDIEAMRRYYRGLALPEDRKNNMELTLSKFERQLQSIAKLSPLPAVNYILKAAGYERYLREIAGNRREKWQEWQELIEWLKEDAARFGSAKEWKAFQEEYTKNPGQNGAEAAGRPAPGDCGVRQCCTGTGQRVGAGQCGTGAGQRGTGAGQDGSGTGQPVQLLTVHGSKGLEFDRVWIPDCNEGVFPHGRMPDTKSVEEERRIFYVAMTRARERLELLYLTGTKERPLQPSRFLNPLLKGQWKS